MTEEEEYFYSGCPVCTENGNINRSFWKHKYCGGLSKVNSKGDLWCENCPSTKRKFVDWLFECENHRPKEIDDEFKVRYIFGVIIDAKENKNNMTFWLNLLDNVTKQIREKLGK